MRSLAAFAIFVLSNAALAGRHAAPTRGRAAAAASVPAAPAAGSDPATPAAGSCSYVQPGVKICSALADGHGSFDVVTAVPAAVFVRTEEPIVNFIPPDPKYFQADRRDTSVVIAPVSDRLPETTPTIITTKTLTITLRIHPGAAHDADTQLTVRDPIRKQRNAELVEAVAQAEKRASERVAGEIRSADLEAIARAGVTLARPHGHTIARNGAFAVLEARQLVRLGDRQLLLFVVENRGGQPFSISGVRLWVGERAVATPAYKFERSVVEPASEARGVVELPAGFRVGKVNLAVDDVDPRRSVELDGVELR